MESMLGGLELLLTPQSLLWVLVGLLLGFVTGVLPGFGGAAAGALFLPLSIGMPFHHALIVMVVIYAGAQFAGAVPAILVNIPGDAGSAPTAMEGFPMSEAGQAPLAIGIARMASVIGGTLALVIVIPLLLPLSTLALNFGTREMFVVSLLGLLVIGSVSGDYPRKGILSGLLGMLIATMGASPMTAQPRFTLGQLALYEDVPFIPALVGLFAFSQMFILATRDRLVIETPAAVAEMPESAKEGGVAGAVAWFRHEIKTTVVEVVDGIRMTFSYTKTTIRSALLGLLIGIIPGAGTSVGSFMAYGDAKRTSRNPELFGKGAPDGIVASEASDNAVAVGTLVPTLTLGIPGSGAAAVFLAALYLHGVTPGPRVMTTHGAEAYAVIFAMLLGTLLILPVGILVATPLTYIIRLPAPVLVAGVTLFASVGVYASRSLLFDVGLALLFGVLGWLMLRRGYPLIPLVLGLILGPMAETNLMRAWTLARGELPYFFGSLTVNILWGIFALVLLLAIRKGRRAKEAEVKEVVEA